MAKIAFIGLGVMGGPMAGNLVKAGHEVTATDLSIGAIDRAEAAGCKRGKTVAASVCDADFVLTMLPAGEHVRSVYLEPYGIVAHAKKGALLIDCSTIDVASARAVSAAAVTEGLEMADAPVSGDANAAKDGVLTFTGWRRRERICACTAYFASNGRDYCPCRRCGQRASRDGR